MGCTSDSLRKSMAPTTGSHHCLITDDRDRCLSFHSLYVSFTSLTQRQTHTHTDRHGSRIHSHINPSPHSCQCIACLIIPHPVSFSSSSHPPLNLSALSSGLLTVCLMVTYTDSTHTHLTHTHRDTQSPTHSAGAGGGGRVFCMRVLLCGERRGLTTVLSQA